MLFYIFKQFKQKKRKTNNFLKKIIIITNNNFNIYFPNKTNI